MRWFWVNFQCRGVLLVWKRVGQGPTALTVGAGGGCLDIFTLIYPHFFLPLFWEMGWSGGAMALGHLPVPGRPTIWMIVGQGPIALAIGAGGGCLDIFTLLHLFSPLSPSLWETARYRLKYCLKAPLNPKQPTNDTNRGWSGGATVLAKLPVLGRPTNLDCSRARAYCACNGCGWGMFGHFFSRLSFLYYFPLSLGDGPI